MKFKKYQPVTSSQRHLILLNKCFLKKFPLLKSKIFGIVNSSGRNNQGKITVRHKGNGTKHKYRLINFKKKINSTGIITSLEYDPNRTAYIASVYDLLRNFYTYMLAPCHLKIGDIVKSNDIVVKLGHTLNLKDIPLGSFIYCISNTINNQAKFTRSAGTYSKIVEKTRNFCRIKLSSGQYKILKFDNSFATIGIVSNENNFLKVLAKAGRSRWLNIKPSVRGVAMNPIDHPHGGGEGKTSGGRSSVTPWGKPTKNKKTSRLNIKFIKK